MITNFETLTTEEFEKLRQSLAWVTILIAGADGHIDSEEVSWANKIAEIRSYASPDLLNEFYHKVGEDFDTFLESLMESTPKDTKARTLIASDKIAELNPIIAKLSPPIAFRMYESLTSFAMHIAKASGGFLRMWSISAEENKYVNLPMLHVIEEVEE